MTTYLAQPSSLTSGDTVIVNDQPRTVSYRCAWSGYQGVTTVYLITGDLPRPHSIDIPSTDPATYWITVDRRTFDRIKDEERRFNQRQTDRGFSGPEYHVHLAQSTTP